jgi:hypothetical protein
MVNLPSVIEYSNKILITFVYKEDFLYAHHVTQINKGKFVRILFLLWPKSRNPENFPLHK